MGLRLRYETCRAVDVGPELWDELRDLHQSAFAATLPGRSDLPATEKAALLTSQSNPARYRATRVDPNGAVGREFNANQLYSQPRITIAFGDSGPVGFIYGAFNVSGGGQPEGPHNDSLRSRAIRHAKQASIVKNHLWLRDIAVAPDHQGRGIGHELAKEHLKDRQRNSLPGHPVSAYIWPTEVPFLQGALERVGFQPVGDVVPQTIYGEAAEPVDQLTMRAPGVGAILSALHSRHDHQ